MFGSPRTPGRTRRSAFFKSPYATSVNNSQLNQSLNMSNVSVLGETPLHMLEASPSALPVHIVESLLSIQSPDSTSVVLTGSWAWIVVRSRLLVFQHAKRVISKTCFSLELPNSILLHQANLCHVGENCLSPNCLVVSPMGVVRFWPNISHESVYVETVMDMAGEECFQLTYMGDNLFVVATTTGSLIKVAIAGAQGNALIDTRRVKIQQGVLSEIGKRMSSLLFGAMPIAGDNNHRVARRLLSRNGEDVLILFEKALQRWSGWADGQEIPRYDIDLDQTVRENFRHKVWADVPVPAEAIDCWCIDAQICVEGLLILSAAVNDQYDQSLHYALSIFDMDNPGTLKFFTAINEASPFTEANLDSLLTARCLLPHGREAFVHTRTKVMCVNLVEGEQDTLILPQNDRILGCGARDGQPLLLTQINHLVILKTTGRQITEPLLPEDSIRIAESFLFHDESIDQSAESLLRKALVHHTRGEIQQSQSILDQVVPVMSENSHVDGLDQTILDLSESILNEPPAGDHRWGRKGQRGKSVLIENQLADKVKALDFLTQFLKVNGIWKKLTTVTVDGDIEIATRLALNEHRELLSVAVGIDKSYETIRPIKRLLEVAMKRVSQSRKEKAPSRSLTSRDLCFKRVTGISDILIEGQKYLEQLIEEEDPDISEMIMLENIIIVAGLRSVQKIREQFFILENSVLGEREYIPWTARRLRYVLMRQCEISETFALSNNLLVAEKKTELLDQMTNITRIILNDYALHVKSLASSAPKISVEKARQQMSADRQKLIGYFFKHRHFDIATCLCEEFFEFPLLVRICEENNQHNKLFDYMERFSKENFAEYVFQYFVDSGKRDRLLAQPSAFNAQLSRFLQSHGSLHWLHCIKTGDYLKACQALKQLAEREERLLKRKKLQTSIAKLSALACSDSEAANEELIDIINTQDVITIQENLSPHILTKNGFSPETCPVLKPEDMIRFICDSDSRREQDYKIALDLLEFVGEGNKNVLRLDIWARSIVQDEWIFHDGSYITDIMRDLLFFQIVELGFLQERNLNEFMPPIEDLLESPLLSQMKDNDSFQYILRAGYEHVRKMAEA